MKARDTKGRFTKNNNVIMTLKEEETTKFNWKKLVIEVVKVIIYATAGALGINL